MEKNDTISILYVEDQDDVRLFLSKILSRHYSNVFLAENGKQGLELYIEHKPDIVISDIKMPVMDGLSMSSRIKEIDSRAKIILTTAHSDMEYFIQSIEIGISQYILKPIDREKLYYAIDSCKDQVLMERELGVKNRKLTQTNEMLTRQERELRESLQKSIALKELIAQSEENLRKIAENIQDAFWLTDNNKVLFSNEAFVEIFEEAAPKLRNSPEMISEFIHKDDRDQFLSLLKNHHESKSGAISTEFRIVTTLGKVKNIWYRNVYLQPDKKGSLRSVISLSDITWKTENQKLQHNLLLAEKASQLKQRLLANVSHEMRTPLNGIFAMAEILAKTELADDQSDYLATIRKSARELHEMTNNLLDINELETIHPTITYENIESDAFFKSILEKFSKLAREKNLGFKVEFSHDFPTTFISDPNRIRQVLSHLAGNAVKFTSEGEININFHSKVLQKGQYEISFDVTDSGVGIKEDFLENIFQLFAQQEDSENRTFEGLGLGLTICQRIASLMGGSIDVQSEPGKGSSFRFSLPVDKAQSTHSGTLENEAIPYLNINVLCVEDKEVNQKILTIMLGNAGCTVDIAGNGQEALDMYEKGKYELILMDIQMPVMDGLTATKELRKRYTKLPPIIGVSANALRADAEFYIREGLDDYISKPIIPDVFYSKIQQWINGEKIPAEKKQSHPTNPAIDLKDLYDLDPKTLNTLKEQTHDDTSLIIDLYNTFIVESEQLIDKIKQATDEGNNAQLKDATHALKGLSATIGAQKVYNITSEMDKLHKKGIFHESANLNGILISTFEQVKSVIESTITNVK